MLPALRPDLSATAETRFAQPSLASAGAGFRAVMEAFTGAPQHGNVADLLADEDAGTPQDAPVPTGTDTVARTGAGEPVDSAGRVSDVAVRRARDTDAAPHLSQGTEEIGAAGAMNMAAAESAAIEPGESGGPASLGGSLQQSDLATETDPRAEQTVAGDLMIGLQAPVALPQDQGKQTNTAPDTRQSGQTTQIQPLIAPLQTLANLPASGATDGAVAAPGALAAGAASTAEGVLADATPERGVQGTVNDARSPVAVPNSPVITLGPPPAIGEPVSAPRVAEVKRPAGSEALLQGRLSLANPPAAFGGRFAPIKAPQTSQQPPATSVTVQTGSSGQSFTLSDAQSTLPGLTASPEQAQPDAISPLVRPAAAVAVTGPQTAVPSIVGKGSTPPAVGLPAGPAIKLSAGSQVPPRDDSATWPREAAQPAVTQGPSPFKPDTEAVQRTDLGAVSGSATLAAEAARPAPFLATTALPPGFETAQAISRQILDRLPPAGGQRFEIALAPAELGNVTLRLIGTDAGSLLVVQADRAETVDLMRRHIGMLEADLRSLGHDGLTVRFAGHGSGNTGWGPGTGSQGQAWGAPPDRQQAPDSGPGLPGGANESSAGTALPPPARVRSDQLDLRL